MMPEGSLAITWHGEDFVLLRERAVYWPAQRALILSDLHLGKDAAFRAHGVPLGAATTQADLARLSGLVAQHSPERCIILGDVFHSRAGSDGRTLSAWDAWRTAHHQLALTVVLGNHDQSAGAGVRSALGAAAVDQIIETYAYIGKFMISHQPQQPQDAPQLAGHLHPAILLQSRADRLKLHAFLFRQRLAVLPAFGEFIDGAIMRLQPGDRAFAITPTRVIAL
jgi:DNA ligase-associated metallophosphoesterase